MSGPARHALVRWSLRLLRREWRQHVLVVTLLTVAVGAAMYATTAGYNAATSPEGTFGAASHRIVFGADDRTTLDSYVSAAEASLGDVDVIEDRSVAIPGSTESVDFRTQDPTGPLGAPMLDLRSGRYPNTAGEVAVTDGVAALLGAASGESLVGESVTLGGEQLTVVGTVENPAALDDEFVLNAPAANELPARVTVLVDASDDAVDSFDRSQHLDDGFFESRWSSDNTLAALLMLVVATMAMLLVSLVAAAAFVVVAQRRQRQLGMLAAVGATERQLRLVMLADGAAVGAIAAVLGAAVALAAWLATAPLLERASAHRIGRFDFPWPVVAACVLLAVATATAAAWWPARIVSRLPVTTALSWRPPRPRSAHRSAALALVLIAAGITSLAFAVNPEKDSGNVLLLVAGALATMLGVVLLAPSAVRLAARLAPRAPLAPRIALRDLARYQSRSGAALAAISLGLAIAVSIVVVAAAREDPADAGNLSDRQLLVHLSDPARVKDLAVAEIDPAGVATRQAAVDAFVAAHPGATVVPLEVAVDAGRTERVRGQAYHPEVILGIPVDEDTDRDRGHVFVATPELLAALGLDPADVDPEAVLLTSVPGELHLTGNISQNGRGPVTDVQHIATPAYTSTPRALITEHGLRQGGWEARLEGWLIEAEHPFTDDDLAAARELAAEAGLTIESRNEQGALSTVRTIATVSGVALALAILAVTVGLIRSETGGDVRTLTAVGASSRTRRAVTATTAGVLALLAVVLGTAGAYAALIAGYTPATDRLANVPVAQLVTIGVGLPAIATGASWLLAGRQPRHLGRQQTE